MEAARLLGAGLRRRVLRGGAAAGAPGAGRRRGAGADGDAGRLRRRRLLRPDHLHHRHLQGLAGDERRASPRRSSRRCCWRWWPCCCGSSGARSSACASPPAAAARRTAARRGRCRCAAARLRLRCWRCAPCRCCWASCCPACGSCDCCGAGSRNRPSSACRWQRFAAVGLRTASSWPPARRWWRRRSRWRFGCGAARRARSRAVAVAAGGAHGVAGLCGAGRGDRGRHPAAGRLAAGALARQRRRRWSPARCSGLLYAYLVRFSAVALQSVEAGYARMPAAIDDTARMLGAGAWRAWFDGCTGRCCAARRWPRCCWCSST